MSLDDSYRHPISSEDYYLYQDKSLHSALVIEKRVELEEANECVTLESEWEKAFHSSHFFIKLKERALSGKLVDFSFRSLAWRLFLGVIPPDIGMFAEAAFEERDRYDILKRRYVKDPHALETSMSLSVNNPLSQEENSPWAQFFQDTELRKEIMKDISRTYPEEILFEQEEIQSMMLNILFIFARENPDVAYKQGMHELLAPLVFVFHKEYKLVADVARPQSELMLDVMSLNHLEHDLYCTYVKLMEHTVTYYRTDSVKRDVGSSGNTMRLFTQVSTRPSTYVVQKLHDLQNTVLRRFDAELYQHLSKLGIEPQLYGLRWFRLLFGREFTLPELLVLWDGIFAGPNFSAMVECIGISMLLYVRQTLLCCDYAGCISLLMRYPSISNVHYFVQRALFIYSPNNYKCPPNWQHRAGSGRSNSFTRTQPPPPSPPTTRTSSFTKTASSSVAALSEFSDSIKKKISQTASAALPNSTIKARNTSREQARVVVYCSHRLDALIEELQATATAMFDESDESLHEDRFMLALADLKQVRDVLKGNVSLTSILPGESETPSIASTEPDLLPLVSDKGDSSDTSSELLRAPERSLPSEDLETLNLFADLDPNNSSRVLKKKTSSESLKVASTTEGFKDPLSSLLQQDTDEMPDFLKQ